MVGSQRNLTDFVLQVDALGDAVDEVLINLFLVRAIRLTRSVVPAHDECLPVGALVGAEPAISLDFDNLGVKQAEDD